MVENIFEPKQGDVYGKPAETEEVPVVVDENVETKDVEDAAPKGTVAPTFEDLLREKSGGKFSKWDDVEPLLTPKQEIAYANEQSKKVHELIMAGKLDEVIDTFTHQKVLANVAGMDDMAALKLSMKYKYPEATDEEISSELADRMLVEAPEAPAEDDFITDEEYQKAVKTYEKAQASFEKQKRSVEREIKKEAKEARGYLESLKADIVLPDIPTAAPAIPALDPAESERIQKSIQDSFEDALTNLTSHNLKYSEGGVELELGYDIPEAAKDDMIARFEKEEFTEILAKRYVKGDGSLDAKKLMAELHLLENYENIQKSNIKQALAKAKLDTLKDVKNVDLEAKSRQTVTISDADKKNQFAKSVFAA